MQVARETSSSRAEHGDGEDVTLFSMAGQGGKGEQASKGRCNRGEREVKLPVHLMIAGDVEETASWLANSRAS